MGKIHGILKRIKGKTLEREIRRGYTIVFFSVMLTSVLAFAIFSIGVYRTQTLKFCENVVGLNLNLLDSQLLAVQETLQIISGDPRILEIVEYRMETDEIDYAVELYHQREILEKIEIASRNTGIENIYIVDGEGECLYSSPMMIDSEKFQENVWFRELIENVELNIPYISELHDKTYYYNCSEEKCISMVMPMVFGIDQVSFTSPAFVVCDIDLDHILGNEAEDVRFAISDSKGEWYAAHTYGEDEKIRQWVQAAEGNEKTRVKNMGDLMIVSMKTNYYDLRLVGIKEMDEMRRIQMQIFALSLAILSAAVVFILVLSRKTSRYIAAPLKRLIKRCDLVAGGDYEVSFPDEDMEEIRVLSDTIQGMISNIVFLNNKMVEEEKTLSQEKLKALWHQINPHFVNNVLQSIKALAIEGETQKISELSTYLGRVMAYSVYQPYNPVILEEELEHVRNYLKVQNIRYDNQVLYTIECSDEIGRTPILKLTLQPIVENAIEHGRETGKRVVITISAEAEGKDVYIIVHDNGNGISKEKMEELQHDLNSHTHYEKNRSVGILNVNERLKKQYGEAYGIELNSKEGVGTTVVIKLPGTEGEDDESTAGR